ncbi:hypothetical protein Tco_0308935 [Tanacetum coccineum]
MRPRRLLRVLSDFDFKIRYHPGKASVAADTLSRNERDKPLRVRALVMTINSNLLPQIHEAQVESLKTENVKDENLQGMGKELRLVLIELHALGARSYADVRRKPLEFHVEGISVERSDTFQQTRKAEP